MTVEDLQDLELCYVPPYSTDKDIVNHTGYIVNNLLKGDFKQVAFIQVEELFSTKCINYRCKRDYKNLSRYVNKCKKYTFV